MNIYLFDTETGGLDPSRCGITEVSAIVIDVAPGWCSHKVVNRFSSLIKPVSGMEYSEEALNVQGRTLEQLESEGRTEPEVMTALTKFVNRYFGEAKKCSPFAHNSAFDMGFMEKLAFRTSLPMPTNYAHVCTMHMFRAMRFAGHHDCYRATLDAMMETFGITMPEELRHTATGDVESAAACLVEMMRRLAPLPDRGDLSRAVRSQ